MIQSQFMKEFFMISNIYRIMSNLLKEKLLQNNIPLNEAQITILFLMDNNNTMSAESILKMCHFTTSTLLFNLNDLNQNNYIQMDMDNLSYNQKMKDLVNLSADGEKILSLIDNLCANIYTNKNHSPETFLHLSTYEQNLHQLKVK
jgi:hypothetical protein